jgi:DNA modification methylase
LLLLTSLCVVLLLLLWPDSRGAQVARDAGDDAWKHLAHHAYRIIGVTEIDGQAYIQATSFQHRAEDILQLARSAYRLLQYSREEKEWRNTASLRALLIPRRWDRPVFVGPTHQQLRREVVARSLVKFILTKSGHPLPPASKINKQDLYLLDPALHATFPQADQVLGMCPLPRFSSPEFASETSFGKLEGSQHLDDVNLEVTEEASTARSEECIEPEGPGSVGPIDSAGMLGKVRTSLGPYRLDMYHLEDNIQAMRRIPDGSVNTIITSPPFNKAGLYRSVTGKRLTVRQTPSTGSWHHGVPYDNYVDDLDEDEYRELQVEFLKECYRVLTPRGLLFYHHAFRVAGGTEHGEEHRLMFKRAGFNVHETIYWYQSGSVNHNENRLTSVIEPIYLLNRDPKIAPNFFQHAVHQKFGPNLWQINKEPSKDHPCVFPALLVETCILLNSQEGDVILDPHAGSGSVLLAAHNLKRRYVGFDISPKYRDRFQEMMRLDGYQAPAASVVDDAKTAAAAATAVAAAAI